jgi:hypothetical protein
MARKRRQQNSERDALGVVAAGLVGIAGGLYGLSKAEEARVLTERLTRAEVYGKRLLQIRNDERAAFLRLQEERGMLQEQVALLNGQQQKLLREKQELEAELQKCRRENEELREASSKKAGA